MHKRDEKDQEEYRPSYNTQGRGGKAASLAMLLRFIGMNANRMAVTPAKNSLKGKALGAVVYSQQLPASGSPSNVL